MSPAHPPYIGRRPPRSFGRVVALAVTGISVLAACGTSPEADAADDKVLVVATTTQLADFARTIGGDAVEVRGLIRANVDAHDYEPSPADLDALARADVILANGVGLEPWLEAAVEAAGPDVSVTDTSKGVHLLDLGGEDHHDEEEDEDHGHDHEGSVNPHIWLDPTNARTMVRTVADALTEALGESTAATQVTQRATRYDAALVRLDADISSRLESLTSRRLVTDHDAFAYFADRYDLDVVGTVIPSFDTSAEVSAGDLADLAATVERTGARAVFTEQSMPPDAAAALARRVKIRVVAGSDGLLGDSLAPAGSPGDTYLEMMRHNADSIARNLM